tara:strand:+ start:788 stop:979 length:192 start_codon:yes stop_codon:yes gene_type:complete
MARSRQRDDNARQGMGMSDPFRNSDGGFGGYAGINQQNIIHNPSPVDIQDRYGSIDHQGPIQK